MRTWRYIEFSRTIGVIPMQTREALLKESVLPYLNENKLEPEDCKIVCFIDVDPFEETFRAKKYEPRIVYQVFYCTNG